MPNPNTLIFVDLMSDDPVAAGKFYAEVMGWEDDVRMDGQYCRMVPGGNFKNPDGSDSEIGNLHIGIGNVKNLRPNPDPEGVDPGRYRQRPAHPGSGFWSAKMIRLTGSWKRRRRAEQRRFGEIITGRNSTDSTMRSGTLGEMKSSSGERAARIL